MPTVAASPQKTAAETANHQAEGGDFLAKAAFYLGMTGLVFLFGIVTAIQKNPPYQTVYDAWTALLALGDQREILASEWPAYTWMPARSGQEGLVTNLADRTYGDYTLYTSGHKDDVKLLDIAGNVVHQWDVDFRRVWPSGPHVPDWLPSHFVYVRRTHVFPNGDLLALYETTANTPSGCGMAKFDSQGNILWTFDDNAHHDFNIDAEGRIFVLTHRVRRVTKDDTKIAGLARLPIIEDFLTILSPDGQVEKRINVLRALLDSEFFLTPSCHVDRSGDILHSNTANLVGEGFANHHPGVSAGDVMLCLRNLNLVAVIHPESEKLVWATTGPWNHPHDPDPLENGNILIFDNLLVQADQVGAAVVEFDPTRRQIVRTYSRDSHGPLGCVIRGCQQLLPNGNLLVTESDYGRLLEVDPAGETVWEYVNPVRGGDDDALIPIVCGARRYRQDELPFLSAFGDAIAAVNLPGEPTP